ncbi:MAG: DUF937 domain-containing protein [Firmicutes bacterium]|nr:DUF937 domain-containing protein [Bacillota bacterium]
MELTDLLTGALASQIGKKADVDEDTTSALLEAALPILLESMNENSKSKKGAESLAKALLDHADDDDDIDEIDEEDGQKILGHILGGKSSTVTKNLAKVAGDIDIEKAGKVLAIAAPILMATLGSQTKSRKKKKDDDDIADLLGDVLGGALGLSTTKASTKKTTAKKSSSKKKDNDFDLEDLGEAIETAQQVGKVLGKLFK